MKSEEFSKIQVKLLNYGIYTLIFILSSITLWNSLKVIGMTDNMSKNFVQLERYKEDKIDLRDSLKRIESKIDQLNMLK